MPLDRRVNGIDKGDHKGQGLADKNRNLPEFNLANVTRDPDQPMIIQGSWPAPPTMTDYAIARSRVERVDSATSWCSLCQALKT
jgi:hypothetical protein